MKIPTRILGLLVATVAAPVIAGCAGEVADDPSTNTTESNLQSQASSEEEAAQPSAPAAPAAHPAPAENEPAAAPEPDEPEQTEDPCPACGMG